MTSIEGVFASAASRSGDLTLIAVIAVVSLVAMFIIRELARRTENSDPLTGLFDRPTFDSRANEAARHTPRKTPSVPRRTAVLSGRIDHTSQIKQIWGQSARAEAIEQVAQVMRASVRGTDKVTRDGDDNIVIIADGATESEAGEIAQRLMRRLAQTPVPGLDDSLRLTASFGVAERGKGESDDDLHARSAAALDAAQAHGEDRVIIASDWEEVKFLPAPDPVPLTKDTNVDDEGAAAA